MIFTRLIEWMYLHYRKVEDLQFQIEEESMMKDDLEVGNISYLHAYNVCVIWFYLNLNKMGETKDKWRRLDKIQIWHIFTRIFNKSNTGAAICAGTAYLSEPHELTAGFFCGIQSFVLFFLLDIVLSVSVPFQFTASDYSVCPLSE